MRILIFQNHYEYLSRINFVSVTQFPYKRSLKLSGGGGGGLGAYTRLCEQNLCLLYCISQTYFLIKLFNKDNLIKTKLVSSTLRTVVV